jgi:hypothetical protein
VLRVAWNVCKKKKKKRERESWEVAVNKKKVCVCNVQGRNNTCDSAS